MGCDSYQQSRTHAMKMNSYCFKNKLEKLEQREG